MNVYPAGNADKDLATVLRECFFKDPALAAEHSRSRGGKGLFDKHYGVRCLLPQLSDHALLSFVLPYLSCHKCCGHVKVCHRLLQSACFRSEVLVLAARSDGQLLLFLQGALQQLVLRRCLLLVLLLDCAAQRPGVLNDATPLLFRLDAKLKSSAEVRHT